MQRSPALGLEAHFAHNVGGARKTPKRPIRDYLLAIAIFANGAKGHSALQLSRDLCCQYKTAFVLAHKLREAIGSVQTADALGETCEIDGAYFGRHVRPHNVASERVDRRLVENQAGKRQVVVVVRERKGRTLSFVVRKEGDAIPIIRKLVPFGAQIHADESSQWDSLHAYYDMKRINHSEAYSRDGACTNQAESYFSRLRRAEFGIHHKVSGKCLRQYSSEMAWREDFRRVQNGEQFKMIAGAGLAHPVSKEWSGYWNRKAA